MSCGGNANRGRYRVDKYTRDDKGYFVHCGRSDDLLKVGGTYVSPIEVENVLLGHEAVTETAVVWAKDQDQLVKPKAFVVLTPGHQASPEFARELIRHVRGKLAAYKRPRWVEFIPELPRTATGKIQRFKLRDSN